VAKKRSQEKLEFFEKFGFTKKEKIFSPIFEQYLLKKISRNTSTKLEFLLSSQELKVFNLLKQNKESIVSRDQIALVLWEDQAQDKYSDWSIDQIIHRIRNKITVSHSAANILTKKKLGFIYCE
jgi:DNA-binding response OmpR family regulator